MAVIVGDEAKGEEANLAEARKLLGNAQLVTLVRRAVAHPSTPALQRIAAAVELVRRARETVRLPRQYVNPFRLARSLIDRHAFEIQERFGIVLVDTRQRLITARVLTLGSLSRVTASPRDVVLAALSHAAAGVIVYHNHPSGDSHPSAEDNSFTNALDSATESMGINLIDHLVLGAHDFYSYREAGKLASRAGGEE
ncbi:MAG TPA: JAB domain-containing protein [Thermoanaerobaculia bacterium]